MTFIGFQKGRKKFSNSYWKYGGIIIACKLSPFNMEIFQWSEKSIVSKSFDYSSILRHDDLKFTWETSRIFKTQRLKNLDGIRLTKQYTRERGQATKTAVQLSSIRADRDLFFFFSSSSKKRNHHRAVHIVAKRKQTVGVFVAEYRSTCSSRRKQPIKLVWRVAASSRQVTRQDVFAFTSSLSRPFCSTPLGPRSHHRRYHNYQPTVKILLESQAQGKNEPSWIPAIIVTNITIAIHAGDHGVVDHIARYSCREQVFFKSPTHGRRVRFRPCLLNDIERPCHAAALTETSFFLFFFLLLFPPSESVLTNVFGSHWFL